MTRLICIASISARVISKLDEKALISEERILSDDVPLGTEIRLISTFRSIRVNITSTNFDNLISIGCGGTERIKLLSREGQGFFHFGIKLEFIGSKFIFYTFWNEYDTVLINCWPFRSSKTIRIISDVVIANILKR